MEKASDDSREALSALPVITLRSPYSNQPNYAMCYDAEAESLKTTFLLLTTKSMIEGARRRLED